MPIDGSNIIGLFFTVCLLFISIWRIYARWHSHRYLQRNGRTIWATITDIKTEIRTIMVGTRPIQKSEVFLFMTWKDTQSGNEQTFKLKIPDFYLPTLGEKLPIRVSPDGFHNYRLDLKHLQSHSSFTHKKRQQFKEAEGYDTQIDKKEEYEMPRTAYPLQMPEQQ